MNRKTRRALKRNNYRPAIGRPDPFFTRKLASTAALTLLATTALTGNNAWACADTITGTIGGPCSYGDQDVTVAAGSTLDYHGNGSAVGITTDYSHTLTNHGIIGATGSNASMYGVYVNGKVADGGSLTNNGEIDVALTNAQGRIAYGIFVNDDLDGSVINNAAINDIASDTNNTAYAYGIDVHGDVNGNLINNSDMRLVANGGGGAGASAYGFYISGNHVTGSITNTGSMAFTVNGGTRASAYGVSFFESVTGSVTNSGSITGTVHSTQYAGFTGLELGGVGAGGSVTNSGSITASLTAGTSAYAAGIDLTQSGVDGTITNSGSITLMGHGGTNASIIGIDIRSGDINGSITNSGTITLTASGDKGANPYGIVANMDIDGSILNTGSIAVASDGGTGQAQAYGVWIGGAVSGTVANSGSIALTANGDTKATAYGIEINGNLSGAITNSGLITVASVSDDGYASAVGLLVNGNFNGSITNSGAIVATVNGATSALGYGIYMENVAGTLTNSGSITVDVASDAKVSAGGIYVVQDVTGSILNSGSISVTATGGTIVATGIRVAGAVTAPGSVTNSGSIIVTETNHGSGWGSPHGIVVNGNVSGSILNSGTIRLTANNNGLTGGSATGMMIWGGGLTGSMTNSGTIIATVNDNNGKTANAYGIEVSNDVGALGSIVNHGTIIANVNGGTTAAAWGIKLYAALNGTVTNTGTIIATASDNPGAAYSIYANAGTGSVTNTDTGILVGNLNLGGTVDLSNSGRIMLPAEANGGSSAHVGGDYTQAGAASLLGFGAASDAVYSKLTVVGTADLSAGNKLRVTLTPDNSYAGGALTNVVVAGTLTGPNSYTVSDNTLAYNFAGAKNGNAIDITATATGMTTLAAAVPSSGSGVAGVLDSLLANGMPAGMESGLLTITAYDTASQAQAAVSQAMPMLGPEPALQAQLHTVNHIVEARQESNSGFSSGEGFVTPDRHFWLKPFGTWTHQGDRDGAPGYHAGSGGMIAGGDTNTNERTRIGAALAYGYSRVDSNNDSAPQKDRIHSWQGIAYGSYDLGNRTEASWQADLGQNSNDARRDVTFIGQRAYSSYDSWSGHIGGGVARQYAMQGATFIPSVRADYARIATESYTETGAGAWNQHVLADSSQELIFGVDGKWIKPLTRALSVSANAGVGYDVIDDRDSVTSAFVGGGGIFTTPGLKPSPWIGRAGLGLELGQMNGIDATARYDLEARDGFTQQTASVKLRMAF